MSITDGLREWASHINENSHLGYLSDVGKQGLCNIADNIDAAHRSALEKLAAQLDETSDMREFCGRLEKAATNREDVTLWGADYTPLPLDADGVSIHIGDLMVYADNTKPMEVVAIVPPSVFLTEDGPRYADMCRHYHAPTVEDVLTEFGIDWEHESDCEDRAALLAEYAAKLRLAGDE